MSYVYAHLPQHEDIGPDGRSYSITEELLEYQGRRILYLYVTASGISFCDRSYAPHMANINVKGYVVRLKYGENEKGETLSELEPIRDADERRAISRLLFDIHNVPTINFP